jgi:hypothetical protein
MTSSRGVAQREIIPQSPSKCAQGRPQCAAPMTNPYNSLQIRDTSRRNPMAPRPRTAVHCPSRARKTTTASSCMLPRSTTEVKNWHSVPTRSANDTKPRQVRAYTWQSMFRLKMYATAPRYGRDGIAG